MKFFESVKSWFSNIGKKRELPSEDANVTAAVPASEEQKFPKDQKKASVPKKAKGQGNTVTFICQWIFKLRGLFMAIPVVFASIVLAVHNKTHLPEKIAVYFPSNTGEKMAVKMTELTRDTAVTLPLLITFACLILMCSSRRTVYPWIISIFSLVLPLFFLFIGMYPM